MDSTRLRSRPAQLVIAAALLITLVLGVAVVLMQHSDDAAAQPDIGSATPLTDDQSRQQVLELARQFVGAGQMRAVSASYLLSSCTNEEQPPYQGLVYLNFDVPRVAETRAYFGKIADGMAARGWREGLPPGRHPGGRTMAKDGFYAVFYRDPDAPGRGVLKIHGECRNITDHRQDTRAFADVTAALKR